MSFTETIAAGRARHACGPTDPAQPRIAGHRSGQPWRCTPRCHAGGRRHVADRPGPSLRRLHAKILAGDRQHRGRDTCSCCGPLLLGRLPHATLAAVVIVHSVGLIQPKDFAAILKVRKMEFRWALIACLGVMFFGTLQGILLAIVVSLIGLASQTVTPHRVLDRPQAWNRRCARFLPHTLTTKPSLACSSFAPRGESSSSTAQLIGQQIRALTDEHAPRVLLPDLSSVPDLEYSALQMLTEGEGVLAERGVDLWLCGLNPRS